MKYQPKIKSAPLTSEEMRACRDAFERAPRVQEMTIKAQRLIQNGAIEEAMKILKAKTEAFDRTVAICKEWTDKQTKEVQLGAVGLPEAERKHIEQLLVTLYMAIDIMDSCLMDINDGLRKVNKKLSFDSMDDFYQLTQQCKQHLQRFNDDNGLYKHEFWGDITDNMYDMMQNKAMAIIRRYNKAKENG